jgi:Holliday junction resolvase-like predicted endonuclease
MVNKKYVAGRAYEYRIMKSLKKAGFEIIFRSAGSHGPIDVVGIDPNNKIILFVQAKNYKLSHYKHLELKHKWSKLNDKYICKYEIM